MVCQSNSQCLWIIHLMHDLELDEDRFIGMSGSGARGSEVFNVHALGRGRGLDVCGKSLAKRFWTRGVDGLI